LLLYDNQTVRLVERQRPQQNGINYTEHSYIRANSDGQRKDSNNGKTWIFQ
jgi:hypothetical protein